MSDYFPIISRAVDGLGGNTSEDRRVLYERARAALANQLRSAEPPLKPSEITRERLALEDAIRKIEVRAVRRAFLNKGTPALEPEQEPPSSPRNHAWCESDKTATYPAQAKPLADEHAVIYSKVPRDYGRMIKLAAVLLVLIGVGGLGYWQRGAISSIAMHLRSASPVAPTRQSAPPEAGTQKIPDRIRPSLGSAEQNPAEAAAMAAAQKVVLYEEDAANPQGKRFVGSVTWRTETISPGAGLAPELAVRADVEIPERHVRMTWSIRRNNDKALPASHTMEIMFTLPADFPEGGIDNVPGALMKQSEQARGVPLAGLSVKVTNGYFLIGLSSAETDKQRNIQLLKERDWFDIPIVYAKGKRAILAVQKGAPGARVFAEAFRAWGE